MSEARDRLKAKIVALRAKTMANGCTEAEALAAADAVARLMREHDLSEADLTIVEARGRDDTTRATWRTTLAGYVARVTNTSVMFLREARHSELVFVGRDPWPEVAIYLRDVCIRAVTTELKLFKEGTFFRRRRTLRTKRQASADFVDGLILRLGHRLVEMFRSTMDEAVRLEADGARDLRFPGGVDLRRPERETRFDAARSEGWKAGGRVSLSHGVATPAPPQISHSDGDV